MTKYFHSFSTLLFMAASLCHGMDKQLSILNSIDEITAVKNPWLARYIGNDRAIIKDCSHKYSIVDLKTKEAHEITNASPYEGHPLLEVNNKKILTYCPDVLALYDAEKDIQEWYLETSQQIRGFAWNTFKDTVFLCHGENNKIITQYNYATSALKEIPIKDKCCQIMAMHPQQEMMCIADYSGNISFHKLDNVGLLFKKISLNKQLNCCYFCQYSPDGSYIVAGNMLNLFIIDPNVDTDIYPSIKACKDEQFKNIAFHPNGSILATLCEGRTYYTKQFVRYWDIKTRQLMYTAPELIAKHGYDLSFSDDGFEVIVALEGKCVRMLVPFAIQEKCLPLLFYLKQLKEREDWPQDIVHYCMNILLGTFKLFSNDKNKDFFYEN